MAELESRRIVERRGFLLDRRHDRFAIMAGIGAPEACRAVDQFAPVAGDIVHVLGADDQARALLEGPVGRERHPIGFEVVGNRDFCLCHDLPPLTASCPALCRASTPSVSYSIKAWMAGPARP